MGYCYFKCCCTEMAPVLAVMWNVAFQTRNKATWNSMSQSALCRIYESTQDKKTNKTTTIKQANKQKTCLHCFHLDHVYLLSVTYFAHSIKTLCMVCETKKMLKRMLGFSTIICDIYIYINTRTCLKGSATSVLTI